MLYIKFKYLHISYSEFNLSSYGKSVRSRFKKNRKRAYLSLDDKHQISKIIPENFNEVLTGLMLGDGSLRMNGHHALLSIQQTEESLVNLLWSICNEYKLVSKPVNFLIRINKNTGNEKKKVYYFSTLTFPYFTKLYKE
jgi:LAGLIDADG DNA endonuclease family